MTRINTTPEVKDKKGVLLANDLLVKSPNGRMFLKPEKANDDAFVQAVIKKQVEIVGGTTPTRNKVVPVGTEGAKVTADNSEAFIEVPITELTDKDSYWTNEGLKEKNFTVDEKFLNSMTVTQLKAWATKRGIKLTETLKAKIIEQILDNI
ncbi:MAG TPA: hypothetical protein PLT75_15290 [Spirochaetota bacterium]|nr:hypothetical protein [Spirochaetota bacterium]